MIGFPLVMVALSELILQLQKRQHPMVRVIKELRNWVMPLAALLHRLTRSAPGLSRCRRRLHLGLAPRAVPSGFPPARE